MHPLGSVQADKYWFRHLTWMVLLAMTVADEFFVSSLGRSGAIVALLLVFSILLCAIKPFGSEHRSLLPPSQPRSRQSAARTPVKSLPEPLVVAARRGACGFRRRTPRALCCRTGPLRG